MYLAIGAGSIPVLFLINDDDTEKVVSPGAVVLGPRRSLRPAEI